MRRYQLAGIECTSPKPRQECVTGRAAFTLTELLVVIAIIAVLSALGTWGAFAMIGNRQRSNTELTIRVVDKLLKTRWDSVIAEAKKEAIAPATHASLFTLAGGDVERARVIWVKARLVEAFPMSYSDVVPGTLVNTYIPAKLRKPHFAKYQQALALTGGTPGESSACLLTALKTLQADGVSVDEQLGYAIASTDGAPGYAGATNNISTLIDGFQRPLQFQRFFTNAPNPTTSGRNAKFGDATDNDGRLLTPAWYLTPGPTVGTTLGAAFVSQFHAIGPIPAMPSPQVPASAFYVIPAIGSAGRDGAFGSPDDLFSFQLRGD